MLEHRRLNLGCRLLGLWALTACASPGPGPRPDARVQPTPPGQASLEEIFLLPGLQGEPPRLEHVSADGRFLFARIPTTAPGEKREGEPAPRGALRVFEFDSSSTPTNGVAWAEVLPEPLPPQGESGGDPIPSYARRTPRVLLRRGDGLFLAEPAASVGGQWRVDRLLDAGEGREFAKLDSARFSADERHALVEVGAELWRFPLDVARERWPLAASDGENLTASIEAEARGLSFSDDLDVVFRPAGVAKLSDAPGEGDGAPPQRDAQILRRSTGKAVELEGFAESKTIDSSDLSPDGRFVFAVVEDRSNQNPRTLIPDYLTERVSTREARREWADDVPLPRKLFVWDTESGARHALELGSGETFWLRGQAWAPQPSPNSPARLMIEWASEDFRSAQTWMWTAENGAERVLVDRDERWLGGPFGFGRWSADGTAWWFGSESREGSSLPGRAQVFRFDVATRDVLQRTQASGEVASFDLADDGSMVYSFSDAAEPWRRRLGMVSASGAAFELAAPVGWNVEPRIADGGSRVFFEHSSMFVPAEWFAMDARAGASARALTRTAPGEFLAREWIHPQVFQVEGSRGARVHSHVFLPRTTSLERPDRPRATVVFIHGAGYLQNVSDSMTEYEPNLMFHSRLAAMGYVVVDVDYRGSAGYGQDFRTALQYHLGGMDLDDIHRTLDALIGRGVVDRERVACYGGSYGGFLTLMALFTAGERWTAGAALRSVTDWRSYHPGYTQPRLGRPSKNPDAFARSSPIDHVGKLERPLLVLHGMMDSNVFVQDSVRLIEALIDQGKDFEAMLYPSQNHAFSDGAHWLDEYKRIERFLIQHLGAP